MPRPTALRVRDRIEAHASDPASQADDARAMRGEDAMRLRVGGWQVILHDGDVLDVLRIGPRGGVHE